MKHENTLCRVPRLLPEGRKGSLALWEGCTRWFRAVLWGPHPALRATFPSGARLFARPFCLLVRWGKAFWRVRFAYSSVEARLFARSFRLLVRWGKALLRVRFAYLSGGAVALLLPSRPMKKRNSARLNRVSFLQFTLACDLRLASIYPALAASRQAFAPSARFPRVQGPGCVPGRDPRRGR